MRIFWPKRNSLFICTGNEQNALPMKQRITSKNVIASIVTLFVLELRLSYKFFPMKIRIQQKQLIQTDD